MKKNKFKPGKRITIFFIFFAGLFFLLGLWQIERGQAKTVIINQFDSNLKKDPEYLDKESKSGKESPLKEHGIVQNKS